MQTHTLIEGWGFDVGANFARATKNTPIRLAPCEYAKPGHVIGYIAPDPTSSLGFLRNGSEIRIHVPTRAIKAVDATLSQ